jgi:hypothetical protein
MLTMPEAKNNPIISQRILNACPSMILSLFLIKEMWVRRYPWK